MRGTYSDNLIEVVQWCMAPEPADRPQSVFVLQKELNLPDELRYTKLSLGDRVRLQLDNAVNETKKVALRVTQFGKHIP
jgi:hypothetical protein